MDRKLRIGLVGAGMFGGDVHLRAYAELQRAGISAHLGRLGLDHWARDFSPIQFELAAIATRTKPSARRAARKFKSLSGSTPKIFADRRPWLEMLHAAGGLDVLAVATPDDLHAEVIIAGLKAGAHVLAEKPLCLDVKEADQIIAAAKKRNLIVAVDMHKRYDPDHLRIRDELRT